MIDHSLVSQEDLEFGDFIQTPNEDALQLDTQMLREEKGELHQKMEAEPDTVILTHDDADGLSSAAIAIAGILRSNPDEEVVVKTITHRKPFNIDMALGIIQEYEIDDVFILDYGFDEYSKAFQIISEMEDTTFTIFDHHQWGDKYKQYVELDNVRGAIDEDECASTIVADNLPTADHLERLATVTKDWDLWIRDDARSEYLQTFARRVADSPEDYIDVVQMHGPDLPEGILEEIDYYLDLDRQTMEYIVDKENFARYVVNGWVVAIAYTSHGVSADMANEIVDRGMADIASILRPESGGGIYSHSNHEEFVECHKVANKLGGGGHPTAAGFSFENESFTSLAEYWATKGENRHSKILTAIEEITEELE